MSFPTAAYLSDINDTLLLISYNLVHSFPASHLTSHPCRRCHGRPWLFGNTTGRHLADAVRRCSEGLADYNPESILCSLAECRIIIPHGCSWRGASRGSLSGLIHRSERTETDTGTDPDTLSGLRPASSVHPSPLVMALILQRYYPWERTSNAGMKFSRYSEKGQYPPFYLLAGGKPRFYSAFKIFLFFPAAVSISYTPSALACLHIQQSPLVHTPSS